MVKPSATQGIQSVVVTIGTTATDYPIGFKTTSLLMRAATTNTANINISLGTYDILGGSILLRPSESISIDITQILMLKVLQGQELFDTDYITKVTAIAGDAGQVFYLDALGA